MRRVSLCPKTGLKRGAWTPEEDSLLTKYITRYGIWNWNLMPKYAGLARCGKSCRLRWLNYLRPNIRRGNFTREEDEFIIRLHPNLGNRWSVIAANLPGRTDNEIKNHWHSHLSKCQKKILTSKVMKREIMASHTPSNRDIENFYDDSSSSSSYDSTIFSNGANWSNMEAMVADLGRADSNGATWNLHFRRSLTDEEVLQVVEMMSLLDGKQLSEEDDQRFWLKTGSIFSVKEACATLTECRRQQGQLGLQNFNRKLVWKRQVPLKICFFLWVLSRGKVLTHDNLERRGFNIVSRCVFCKENSESIQHLFLECSHIREIWYYFWGVMNQQWDGTMTITEVLQRHESQHLNEVGKIYWAVVNHAILWTIWKERNRREFDGEIKQNWQLVSEIKDLIWRWSLGLENTKYIRLESVMFAFGSLVRS